MTAMFGGRFLSFPDIKARESELNSAGGGDGINKHGRHESGGAASMRILVRANRLHELERGAVEWR